MARFENFELGEFLKSETAEVRGIDNTPTFEVVAHLEELTETILQPLRKVWGKCLTISSGYRCAELNKAVGGASTSGHLYGYAADIVPSGDFDEFIAFAEAWLRDNDIAFDQSIKETSKSAVWWHISLESASGERRRQFKALQV